MPAIDSNLFFQLGQVACTQPQNLFVVFLEPICLHSSSGALLDEGFVPSDCCDNACDRPRWGESCFSNIPPSKKGCVPQDQTEDSPWLPSPRCQHTGRPYTPASRTWPNRALPQSPFPAVFYKAISSSSWVKTPEKRCHIT